MSIFVNKSIVDQFIIDNIENDINKINLIYALCKYKYEDIVNAIQSVLAIPEQTRKIFVRVKQIYIVLEEKFLDSLNIECLLLQIVWYTYSSVNDIFIRYLFEIGEFKELLDLLNGANKL